LAALALCSAAAFASGYWVSRARAAGAPAANALTYSGVLSDVNGVPLSGMKNVLLQLYGAVTGGTALCGSTPAAVTLVGGAFSVSLGESCTAVVHANPDLWIDVLIDGASLGRTKLGAVPYALEAAHSVSATTATTATSAATALAAGGDLAAALSALQTSVAALKAAAAPLTTIHPDSIVAADGDFATPCLANGLSGGNTVLHACTLAANRKCTGLGYAAGVFVGESNGSLLSIYCIK